MPPWWEVEILRIFLTQYLRRSKKRRAAIKLFGPLNIWAAHGSLQQRIFMAIFKGLFFGVPPSDGLAFLRFSEFHKMDSSKIKKDLFLSWSSRIDHRRWFAALSEKFRVLKA